MNFLKQIFGFRPNNPSKEQTIDNEENKDSKERTSQSPKANNNNKKQNSASRGLRVSKKSEKKKSQKPDKEREEQTDKNARKTVEDRTVELTTETYEDVKRDKKPEKSASGDTKRKRSPKPGVPEVELEEQTKFEAVAAPMRPAYSKSSSKGKDRVVLPEDRTIEKTAIDTEEGRGAESPVNQERA